MKIGVWVDANIFAENAKFYNIICKLGVDFLVTDYPLVAIEARNKWEIL
jgi:glycerophosphoryl diester phosphodiesterase